MKTKNFSKFESFFSSVGRERLDGISHELIDNLSESERKEAFNFLFNRKLVRFGRETVSTAFLLNPERALADIEDAKRKKLLSDEGNVQFLFEKYKLDESKADLVGGLMDSLESKNRDAIILALGYLPVEEIGVDDLRKLIVVVSEEKDDLIFIKGIQKILKILGFTQGNVGFKSAYISLRKNRSSSKKILLQLIEDSELYPEQ